MKVKCRCRCHVDPNYKHVKACCVNGYVEMPDFKADNYPDITPPTTEEAELWKEIIKYLDQDIDYFLCIPELMQKYQLSRRSEQNPDWQTTFLKEPVTFLLTNAMMHLNPEQLIALRNALVERTPKEENSEAIELLNWMAKNHVICGESANGSASFLLNEDIATKEGLYQEFQLFKQKQSDPKPATPGLWYARLESCKTPEDVDELEKKHADAINANPDLRRLLVIYKMRLKKNLS